MVPFSQHKNKRHKVRQAYNMICQLGGSTEETANLINEVHESKSDFKQNKRSQSDNRGKSTLDSRLPSRTSSFSSRSCQSCYKRWPHLERNI